MAQGTEQGEDFEDQTDDLVHGEIRRRAHRYWEEEGRPEGRAFEHWARAERDILNGATPVRPLEPKRRH